MISIFAFCLAGRIGEDLILSQVLKEKPSVIVQFWIKGKAKKDPGVNHLICIDSTGKVTREFNPVQSFSGLKISRDSTLIASSKQVAAPPGEKRDYITEIPPYNTNIQIADASKILFKQTFHSLMRVFWMDSALHSDIGTTISRQDKSGSWLESPPLKPPVAGKQFSRPESRGEYFSFQKERELPIFTYHVNGKDRTCQLSSSSPCELMSLTGTPNYLYIDGMGGGIFLLDGQTGISRKSNIRHFEFSAWLPGSKLFASMPVVLVPSDAHISLYDLQTKKSRILKFPNRKIRTFLSFNSHELLVSSIDSRKHSKGAYLDRVDPVSGKITPVMRLADDESPWLQLDACSN